MMKSSSNHSPFTKDVIAVIVLCYAVSGVILLSQVGLWEMVRYVLINGVIVIAWLWSASIVLRDIPVPETERILHPIFEVACLLVGLIVAVGLVTNRYASWLLLPDWLYYIATIGTVLILFIGLHYPISSLGLAWPSKRAWLALLAVILVNFGAAILFQVLPPGEKAEAPQSDLANQITGPLSILFLFVGLLFRAALPEELLFRVGLQPRLARFVPLGWAILIQALLFSTAHLPQKLILYQEPLLLSLGYSLALDNGLISGYLWHRTRSLPLLLVLHLFAFPRWGI